MFCCAFLIKYSACVFWVPLVLSVFWVFFQDKQYAKIVKSILYFLSGFGISILPIIIYFVANSALNDFYWGYFEFNQLYLKSTERSISETIIETIRRFGKYLVFDTLFFVPILFGAAISLLSKKFISNISYRIGILLSFIFTYLLIAASLYNMNYAYIALPVFAIMGLVYIFGFLDKKIKIRTNTASYYILSFIVIYSIGVYSKRAFWSFDDIECFLGKKECQYMQRDFANVINKRSNPTLLDIEQDKGIYTAANIVPSYKYFFHPYISDEIFPEIKKFQVNLIKNKEPMFVITIDKDFPYLQENYNLVKTISRDMLFERKE